VRCMSCNGPLVLSVALLWRGGLVEVVTVRPYCFYAVAEACPPRGKGEA
jgi:hypothetical protein